MNEILKRMLQPYKTDTREDAERALREILQEIVLVGLWRGKFFEHAAFYGGTALRIIYGLDRFSEDLDFTLLDKKHAFDWNNFEKSVVDELVSYGFEVSFSEKDKKTATAVKSAFLKTNTLHALMQIGVKSQIQGSVYPEAVVRIKVEIDSEPILGFGVEPIYLRQPLPAPIRVVKESSLFAGKTHAALYRAWKHRVKGRDWYDLVWFLRRGTPLNVHYLEMCMRQNGELATNETLSEQKIKDLLYSRLKTINLSSAKDDVLPFVRDTAQLDLWTIDFFHHWIEKLIIQSN